jgi:hypothetical protein
MLHELNSQRREKMVLKDRKEVQEVSPKEEKPYCKPELRIYGDLGTITRAANNGHPNADGGVVLTKT